ncbi:DUF982 domain-containing protein [Mesorhizobium sp. NBSH29]|uniref:DUF982 domain-containing protein n=1 Tax=Mesorhizobium sp. NBSH29 TaxID=2654249 RepID=UPI00189651F9|nr:DUF982 domain-containing protein [Mesorhizobium sp. NBSH29]QPC86250.1 DUF982 domain-containing protein [Mesorhizobium sp. NBSH29]
MTDHFDSDVKLTVGNEHTIRTVQSVKDACEVLIDWPQARRGPFYQSTREVVEAAIAGKKTAEEARTALMALAVHAGVLVDS